MGRLVEGVWDCAYCGTKNIRARYKSCPHCGASQDKDTIFRLPNQITYVSKEEAKHISRNPDWQCSYCGQLNRDNEGVCEGCGALKADSEHNYFQLKEKREQREQELAALEAKSGINSKERLTQFNRLPILKNIGIIISLIFLIMGIVWLVAPKSKSVTVDEVFWEYSIDIEELQTINESDWSLPPNARLQHTKEELQRYEQVIDHYETVEKTESRQVIDYYEEVVVGYKDLGNGYFEEQIEQRPVYKTEYYTVTEQEPVYVSVPIYPTKYYNEIDKWIVIDTITTSGTDKKPYYGQKSLNSKQRYGDKSQAYALRCTDEDGKSNTYTINYDDWNTIQQGDKLEIQVNTFGIIKSIKKLNK